MPRFLIPTVVALVLAAAPAPELGRASLEVHLEDGDALTRISLHDEGPQVASARIRTLPDGRSEVQVSVRVEQDHDGTVHAASASLLAVIPAGGLDAQEYEAAARSSHAVVSMRGPIVETHRQIRPTEARLRIERIADGEIQGAFWMEADRVTTARITGQFVAPLAPEM